MLYATFKTQEIRAAADIVLQADHEHDAVAEAIRQYV